MGDCLSNYTITMTIQAFIATKIGEGILPAILSTHEQRGFEYTIIKRGKVMYF